MADVKRWLACSLTVLMMTAVGCTEENPGATGDSNNGNNNWVSEDGGLDASATDGDSQADDAVSEDTSPSPDVVVSPDGSTTDTAPTQDTGGGATDSGPTGDTTGQSCMTTAECSDGQACCATNWSGDAVCEPEAACDTVSYCQSHDECPDGQGCCDFMDPGICRARCAPDNGPSGSNDPCTDNTDCTVSGEICCSNGSDTICVTRDSCRTGGICSDNAHCTGTNETCCDLGQLGKRCIDQNWCSF